MIFRLASFKWVVPWSVAMLALQSVCLGQTEVKQKKAQSGRSIEFSESSGNTATNLNSGARNERLIELEKDVVKPFESFNPRSSLEGVAAPPVFNPPPSPQSKKYKELLERRKNWIFMTPEDLSAGTTAAEIFNLPEYDEDGLEKKAESALDRFYRRMDKRSKGDRRGKENDGSLVHKNDRDFQTDEEEAELQGLRNSEQSLKNMFETKKAEDHSLSPLMKPQTLTDVFGLSSSAPPERTAAQKARLEEFKQLLAPPTMNPSLQPFNVSPSLPALPNNPAFGGFDNTAPRTAFPSVVGTISPAFGPSVGVRPLEGGLRPVGSLAPTRIETPKMSSPPVFSVPQRKF